jgi:hypothetical protein
MGMKFIFCSCCCWPKEESVPLKDMIDYSEIIQQDEERRSKSILTLKESMLSVADIKESIKSSINEPPEEVKLLDEISIDEE